MKGVSDMRHTAQSRRGMTLVEIAMVISVIGLMATTMGLTVRRALQAKIADATQQLSHAGTGGGGTFALSGMKAYEPSTGVSDTTVAQKQSTTNDYNKGATDYTSHLDVTREGTETTAGAEHAGDDQQWLDTRW